MTITAKMIADSVGPSGVRLCTMQLKYPRFIHAEFMTHRVFSRNASSSRAIPVEKMLSENCDAAPIHYGMNQSGMQAQAKEAPEIGRPIWSQARNWAKEAALHMAGKGIHKQVVNRLTEPFQHINVIVSATEWENFFKLRLHPDAQPEIQELARVMKEAMLESTPHTLFDGQFHLPYITMDQYRSALPRDMYIEEAIKCSVARCARVSYLNHDQTEPDIKKDIGLYNRLLSSGHMSPFEHVATPFSGKIEPITKIAGATHQDKLGYVWSGNFREWAQYRQLLT
jgi:thymidylate synthase ThyX